MTKEEFVDWKRHPVTEQVFSELRHRVDVLTAEVVEQAAYIPQSEIAEKTGAIKAIRDLLTIEFEETN